VVPNVFELAAPLAGSSNLAAREIKFKNHVVAFRSDFEDKSRGFLCLTKENIQLRNIKAEYSHSKSTNNKYNLELISFTLENYLIITGYKSPKTPNSILERQLQDLFNSTIVLDQFSKILLIGDFNIDINNENNILTRLLLPYNMQSVLPPKKPTTNLNTRIDVIFSTNEDLHADVYETFFSYHKPIYVSIFKTSVKTKSVPTTKLKVAIENSALITHSENIQDIPPDDFQITELTESDLEIIKQNNGYLEDIHIDIFHEILKKKRKEFSPQSVLYIQNLRRIKPITRGTPNLQILFDPGCGDIGHWICTYFDGNINHVYDSLNRNSL